MCISTDTTSFRTSRVRIRRVRARAKSTDDGDIAAWRYDHWKMIFMEQRTRWHAEDLAGTIRDLPLPLHLQPPDGSVRARADYVEHLLRLDVPTYLPAGARAGDVGEFQATFRVPAATEVGRRLLDDGVAYGQVPGFLSQSTVLCKLEPGRQTGPVHARTRQYVALASRTRPD